MFAVNVPRAAPRADTGPGGAHAVRSPLPASGRLLFVEDNEAIRDAVQLLLAAHGFDISTVATPEEALDQIRTGPLPDAIVSDYRISHNRNGIELVRDLRRVSGRQIPAVLLTGDIGLTRLPPDAVSMQLLHKPVDSDSLLDAVERMVRRSEGPGEIPTLRSV